MYKLILYILLSAFVIVVQAQQLDEEASLQMFFRAKHAVDRAAHAAAQQLQANNLSSGHVRIDENQARQAAMDYLRFNLFLDENDHPLPDTMLKSKVELIRFIPVNSDQTFPYVYKDSEYDYEVVLHKPGVIMMVKVHYPSMFQVLAPIEWIVKGTGETYLP